MVPNIDLIVVAILHGLLVSFFVALVTCLIFICLLVAFSITLLLVVFVELYDISSYVSWYLVVVKSHVELALVLSLFILMQFLVVTALASKAFVEGVAINVKMKIHMLKKKN